MTTGISLEDCIVRESTAGSKYGNHRRIWKRVNGPIPEGLTIDHLCRVKRCENLAHMELVSMAENNRRKPTQNGGRPKGYSQPGYSGHGLQFCRHGHEYTMANTYTAPNGSRQCRECRRARWREMDRRRNTAC